mmetsp:Transcript_17555/g.48944  ORF Transcript_17555/g.48944 Transcript_17555/m.48944 type:complete len:211 (-) Transcript_17555:777-1409(-)
MADTKSCTSPASLSTAGASWFWATEQDTPRVIHSLVMSALTCWTMEVRSISALARMSTESCTEPGMTLDAPGHTRSSPTVHTSISFSEASSDAGGASGPPPQMCSMAEMMLAPAAKASARPRMGTVPACPCVPFTTTHSRVCPAMAETAPRDTPKPSSTGPCSMCTSTYSFTDCGGSTSDAAISSAGRLPFPAAACSASSTFRRLWPCLS